MALASFAVLATLFALGVGLHLFGNPAGGRPQVSLGLSLPADPGPDSGAEDGAPAQMAQAPAVMGEAALDEPAPAIDIGTIRVIPTEQASEGMVLGEPARANFDGARVSLAAAPVPGLHAEGENGPVPVIGPSGERAADIYARPYSNPEGLPRVALVIGGLGINPDATRAAIERLPGEVTLSFVPYADDIQTWIDLARANGHEVLVELPMEPFDYPNNNPGPATLLTGNSEAENASHLDWVMSRAAGYVGLMNYQGARLTAHAPSFAPVLSAISDHGLLYLDDGNSQRSLTRRLGAEVGGEWAVANGRIDLRRNGAAIGTALLGLEAQARDNGVAIGVGFAYPVTVDEIIDWAETLEIKGVSLAPLSAATRSEAS